MKLSDAQYRTLIQVRDASIPRACQTADKRSANALRRRGLIEWQGLHFTGGWALTDAGRKALENE